MFCFYFYGSLHSSTVLVRGGNGAWCFSQRLRDTTTWDVGHVSEDRKRHGGHQKKGEKESDAEMLLTMFYNVHRTHLTCNLL